MSQIIKNANFQGHLITAVSECAEDRVHNLIFLFYFFSFSRILTYISSDDDFLSASY